MSHFCYPVLCTTIKSASVAVRICLQTVAVVKPSARSTVDSTQNVFTHRLAPTPLVIHITLHDAVHGDNTRLTERCIFVVQTNPCFNCIPKPAARQGPQ